MRAWTSSVMANSSGIVEHLLRGRQAQPVNQRRRPCPRRGLAARRRSRPRRLSSRPPGSFFRASPLLVPDDGRDDRRRPDRYSHWLNRDGLRRARRTDHAIAGSCSSRWTACRVTSSRSRSACPGAAACSILAAPDGQDQIPRVGRLVSAIGVVDVEFHFLFVRCQWSVVKRRKATASERRRSCVSDPAVKQRRGGVAINLPAVGEDGKLQIPRCHLSCPLRLIARRHDSCGVALMKFMSSAGVGHVVGMQREQLGVVVEIRH